MTRIVGRALLMVVVCAGCLAAEPANLRVSPVRVTVHSKVLHAIDDRIFGQFMERPSWGSEIGAEAAVEPGTRRLQAGAKKLIQAMGIPVVRFPGGTDADFTDWCDMVDNVPGRSPSRPVTMGHTGNQVTNQFGYDEFLGLCEELAMQPILVVNFREGLLGALGREKAARKAAQLAAYCCARPDDRLPSDLAIWARLREQNGRRGPYRVPYLQIGNETWAFAGKTTSDNYLETLRAYLDELHAASPGTQFIVDGQPVELAERVHRELGDRIAFFAVHHYQPWQIREVRRERETIEPGHLSAQDIWYAWVTTPQIDSLGHSVFNRGELEQARRLGYKVAMTEWNWNGWWGASLRPHVALDSLLAKGLGAAGILHAIMRSGDVIEMANQSMLVGDGWDIHAIYCDRRGQSPPHMLPSGQATALYSQHHGRQRLAIDVAGMEFYEQPLRMGGNAPASRVAVLDLLVTRSTTRLYLHAINRHFDRVMPVQLDIAGLGQKPSSPAMLHVLAGRLENRPAGGELAQPAEVRSRPVVIEAGPITAQLPARSVSVLEIPLQKT